MKSDFDHDVFISYHHDDIRKVKQIYDKMTDFGLNAFWDKRGLPPGKSFPHELEDALLRSRHFMLYCSDGALNSEWVHQEIDIFWTSCHLKDKHHRRMYILLDSSCNPERIPPRLQNLQRPSSLDKLIASLLKTNTGEEHEKLRLLEEQLERQTRMVEEAQGYYGHRRFWGPIVANRDIHIFTCARDVIHDPNSSRGIGGRTNIDIWDYRAVLDISHFLASNYPNAQVTIEDPMRKLQGRDLNEPARLTQNIRRMKGLLENKDCIIIGSPDVSDFAEIVLAQIHKITSYAEERIKRKGFVIIKERKHTRSSFYWEKTGNEVEGIAEIESPGHYEYFPHVLATEDGDPGEMYGILVVANNPFCREGLQRKIVILSGFSGVATNAISKILTDNKCLVEFFRLDHACANTKRDVEALIRVEYDLDKDFTNRDTRVIKDPGDTITFEKLVEI